MIENCKFKNKNYDCTNPKMYENCGELNPSNGVFIYCSPSLNKCDISEKNEYYKEVEKLAGSH